MKQKLILKKNWNNGIDVIYDEGKEIKLSTSIDDFQKNLIGNVMKNLDISKVVNSIDVQKLSWSFKEKTIKNIIKESSNDINEIVLESVIYGLKDTISDIKKDTWKKLV